MKETIWKPILAMLLFLALQMIFGAIGAELGIMTGNAGDEGVVHLSPTAIVLVTALSGIACILIMSCTMGMFRLKDIWPSYQPSNRKNGTATLLGMLSFIAGVLASNLLSERLTLQNELEEEFLAMSHSWVGILGLAIFSPIIEEVIFREGIQGFMTRKGVKPSIAILATSLAFGIIHLNPAQIPFAFLLGLLLGILYWKTGNILLCGAMHVLNNSLAVLQMNVMGNEGEQLTEWVGGQTAAYVATPALAIASIVLMWAFCSHYSRENAA